MLVAGEVPDEQRIGVGNNLINNSGYVQTTSYKWGLEKKQKKIIFKMEIIMVNMSSFTIIRNDRYAGKLVGAEYPCLAGDLKEDNREPRRDVGPRGSLKQVPSGVTTAGRQIQISAAHASLSNMLRIPQFSYFN